jgi:ATP-binding cassette subfamily G (WHITE) protein 2 (SNQ2)
MFSLFNGVVRPYSQLSGNWKYWIYYMNPSTYWVGGVLAATLNNTPVQCEAQEAAYFNPPSGSNCSVYARDFISTASGYLMNPDAIMNCAYCPYSTGNDYLATLNIKASDKWRDFGIFLMFCISNWALVYFFIYTVRIRGWSFGFSTIFTVAGKGVSAVKGLFKKGENMEESGEESKE